MEKFPTQIAAICSDNLIETLFIKTPKFLAELGQNGRFMCSDHDVAPRGRCYDHNFLRKNWRFSQKPML
jgi:hypothetical protein